ncbi:MAG: DUF3786 domain-containing protein [Thermodesulfobacteriota bacterium]
MAPPLQPLAIFKLLAKTNCKECLLPSCMAFAVAVAQGQRDLADCPHVAAGTTAGPATPRPASPGGEEVREHLLDRYRQEVANTDLAAAARRLGLPLVDGMVVVTCLGKELRIRANGDLVSHCHRNTWVQVPLLGFILHGQGLAPAGQWVAFGELAGTGDWQRFFAHRCEQEMHRLADAHPELFFEILRLFGARPLAGVTNADRSLVIQPLPGVPFLVNYWQPEEEFPSQLNILLDRTATANSTAQCLYLLGRGLVEMFRALIVRHSRDGRLFDVTPALPRQPLA